MAAFPEALWAAACSRSSAPWRATPPPCSCSRLAPRSTLEQGDTSDAGARLPRQAQHLVTGSSWASPTLSSRRYGRGASAFHPHHSVTHFPGIAEGPRSPKRGLPKGGRTWSSLCGRCEGLASPLQFELSQDSGSPATLLPERGENHVDSSAPAQRTPPPNLNTGFMISCLWAHWLTLRATTTKVSSRSETETLYLIVFFNTLNLSYFIP